MAEARRLQADDQEWVPLPRASWLMDRYAMPMAIYIARLVAQAYRCGACRRRPRSRPLHVDHDHTTGAFRGLLCGRCNQKLQSPLIRYILDAMAQTEPAFIIPAAKLAAIERSVVRAKSTRLAQRRNVEALQRELQASEGAEWAESSGTAAQVRKLSKRLSVHALARRFKLPEKVIRELLGDPDTTPGERTTYRQNRFGPGKVRVSVSGDDEGAE